MDVDLPSDLPGVASALSGAADPVRVRPIPVVLLFGATMFLSATLLFLVQPMFARMVLPRLGGSPAVWNTCVLFFQAALLVGYCYSHLTVKWFGVRRQALLHLAVLLLPILSLPLSAGSGVPEDGASPVWWLLTTMAVTVGVPFFVVATSAPLLQRWFAALPLPSARDPYFLYATSNAGSMLALLSYPLLLEPTLRLQNQTWLWTAGYAAFACAAAACVVLVRRDGVDVVGRRELTQPAERITGSQRLRWLGLSFVPSSLMLGVTMYVSTDIASVPLLWIVPLALYLLTFVLAFSPRPLIPRVLLLRAVPVLAAATLVTIALEAHPWSLIPLHVVTFFAAAMVCHDRLAGARPDVTHLTEFYLWVSIGGVLGGIFNTLIAPQIFVSVFEYPLMLVAVMFLVPVASWSRSRRPVRAGVLLTGLAVVAIGIATLVWATLPDQIGLLVLAIVCGMLVTLTLSIGVPAFRALAVCVLAVLAVGGTGGRTLLFSGRSFFGVVRVLEPAGHTHRILMHGSTMHGRQELTPGDECQPRTYYTRVGPIGDVFDGIGARFDDVAVVGLGSGSLACYSRTGQHWTFYEIDPLVERVATNRSLFSHLALAPGDVRVITTDGRIGLQRAPESSYDLIVLDAFSSDAIPVHLLTREAVQLYASRLKKNGVLLIHISNRYLELEPIVAAITQRVGLTLLSKVDGGIPEADRLKGRVASHWLVAAPDEQSLAAIAVRPGWHAASTAAHAALWTDDYSNLIAALNFR